MNNTQVFLKDRFGITAVSEKSNFRWAKLLGTDLLPGDVVSIGRPSTHTGGEDKTVPADMLLLVGSAIVNEAILTGESTPQWKVLSFLNVILLLPCWLLFPNYYSLDFVFEDSEL